MIIVRWDLLSKCTVPISKHYFGPNKTWRGFLVVMVLNGLFLYLVNIVNPLFSEKVAFGFGVILGLTYMLFELPNSMLKRYMGIPSGEQSYRIPAFFSLLDKSDSAFGVSIISKLIFGFTWMESGIFFIGSVLLHMIFSFLLVVLGIKQRF